jgi:transposase
LELTNDILLKDLVIQLLQRVDTLEAENTALRAENAALKLENEEFRIRLNKNSQNSNKPPSTDGLGKKPAIPRAKGQKTGAQFGHKGRTLKMVEQADVKVVHHAASCPCCSKSFTQADVESVVQKRQVFDIPEPRLMITEHQLGVITCCGQKHLGAFPKSVSQPVQYGAKIKALSVLLNTDYKIPLEKIEQLLGDLYGCSFNESTALSANATCFDALEVVEEEIKYKVTQSPIAHFDETGMRVEGKLHWFHVASTTLFTYLFVHANRGKEALLSAYSVIKDFKNRAVHDCWKSYFDFDACSHSLCNAHILRELESLQEQGSKWAPKMKDFLLELFDLSQKATVIVPGKDDWVQKYKQICHDADFEEPPPTHGKRGRPKNSKGRNLLNRLAKHQDGVLAFAFLEGGPFTNNQAERDIRPLKTKQKVATSFRTFKGAQHHARIQSFVSTLRKHNMSVFQNLIKVLEHKQVVFELA